VRRYRLAISVSGLSPPPARLGIPGSSDRDGYSPRPSVGFVAVRDVLQPGDPGGCNVKQDGASSVRPSPGQKQ
jgi:hypothetical protein